MTQARVWAAGLLRVVKAVDLGRDGWQRTRRRLARQIGNGHWLRIPLGKLRNDRYVPLHPDLVKLLAAWTAANLEHIRRHKRLVTDTRGQPV
jgi:hypothetical protein